MIPLLARIALVAVALCAIAAVASGPLYRFGLLELPAAFSVLRWSAWIAIGITVIAVVLVLLALSAKSADSGAARRALRNLVIAIAIGIATMTGPLTMLARGRDAPPIHDITTDTDNPPQFIALLHWRTDARNPPTYGGPGVAAQQKQAYPAIAPLELAAAPKETFDRALALARDSGWTIVSTDPDAGRIEATATTAFFGFKDDVVIRITPNAKGSRVDMRSLSRIGVSDLGANARRIQGFLAKLGGK